MDEKIKIFSAIDWISTDGILELAIWRYIRHVFNDFGWFLFFSVSICFLIYEIIYRVSLSFSKDSLKKSRNSISSHKKPNSQTVQIQPHICLENTCIIKTWKE
jgi:hypothetical protein